jgi:hypothetical protein
MLAGRENFGSAYRSKLFWLSAYEIGIDLIAGSLSPVAELKAFAHVIPSSIFCLSFTFGSSASVHPLDVLYCHSTSWRADRKIRAVRGRGYQVFFGVEVNPTRVPVQMRETLFYQSPRMTLKKASCTSLRMATDRVRDSFSTNYGCCFGAQFLSFLHTLCRIPFKRFPF